MKITKELLLEEAGYSGTGKYKYKIYHSSMNEAFEEARRYAIQNGYTLEDESLDREIQSRGSWADIQDIDAGQTKIYNIELLKNGVPVKNHLMAIQIYNMGYNNTRTNDYLELNMYVS